MIPPTDSDLVKAAAATYQPSSEPLFEDFEKAIRVFKSRTADDSLTILAVEGTHSSLGWAIDFAGASIEDQQGMNHATLGLVHSGFYASAVSALARCALVAAEGPYAICGHSLGGALALLIGGLLAQDAFEGRDLTPVKIGAFAPPRVGAQTFVDFITHIPICAYRYGDDPVTEVPMTTLLCPYRQVPLIHVGPPQRFRSPLLSDVTGLIRGFHHIANYVAAVLAREQSTMAES